MDFIRCNLGFGLLVWVLGFIGLIQFQFQTHKLGLAQVRYFLFSTTATISLDCQVVTFLTRPLRQSIVKEEQNNLERYKEGIVTCFPRTNKCQLLSNAVSTTIKWWGVSDFKSMKWPLKPGLPMTNKQNYGFTSYQLRGSLNS